VLQQTAALGTNVFLKTGQIFVLLRATCMFGGAFLFGAKIARSWVA
jgi:hypothetical protein